MCLIYSYESTISIEVLNPSSKPSKIPKLAKTGAEDKKHETVNDSTVNSKYSSHNNHNKENHAFEDELNKIFGGKEEGLGSPNHSNLDSENEHEHEHNSNSIPHSAHVIDLSNFFPQFHHEQNSIHSSPISIFKARPNSFPFLFGKSNKNPFNNFQDKDNLSYPFFSPFHDLGKRSQDDPDNTTEVIEKSGPGFKFVEVIKHHKNNHKNNNTHNSNNVNSHNININSHKISHDPFSFDPFNLDLNPEPRIVNDRVNHEAPSFHTETFSIPLGLGGDPFNPFHNSNSNSINNHDIDNPFKPKFQIEVISIPKKKHLVDTKQKPEPSSAKLIKNVDNIMESIFDGFFEGLLGGGDSEKSEKNKHANINLIDKNKENKEEDPSFDEFKNEFDSFFGNKPSSKKKKGQMKSKTGQKIHSNISKKTNDKVKNTKAANSDNSSHENEINSINVNETEVNKLKIENEKDNKNNDNNIGNERKNEILKLNELEKLQNDNKNDIAKAKDIKINKGNTSINIQTDKNSKDKTELIKSSEEYSNTKTVNNYNDNKKPSEKNSENNEIKKLAEANSSKKPDIKTLQDASNNARIKLKEEDSLYSKVKNNILTEVNYFSGKKLFSNSLKYITWLILLILLCLVLYTILWAVFGVNNNEELKKPSKASYCVDDLEDELKSINRTKRNKYT